MLPLVSESSFFPSTFHSSRTICSSLNKPLCSLCPYPCPAGKSLLILLVPNKVSPPLWGSSTERSTWLPSVSIIPLTSPVCCCYLFLYLSFLLDSFLLESKDLSLSSYPAESGVQAVFNKCRLSKRSQAYLSGQLCVNVGSFSNLERNLNKWESLKWLICMYVCLYRLL